MNLCGITFDDLERAASRPPLQLLLSLTLFLLPLALSFADSPDFPVFVAQIPNPNDYSLFANSGWDGNWYVGYNYGWIKKLPAVPRGSYVRAYVGAKMGRMKTLPPAGRPPQFSPIPGELWIGISSTSAWKPSQRFNLTTTDDIPCEASTEYALECTGESEWYWAEVPVDSVNLEGDNYLALWSPTPELLSISSAPVLAAGWGGKEGNAWLAKDLKGAPPEDSKVSLGSGLSYFQPALALKLIPAGNPHPMRVSIVSWQNGIPDHLKPVLTGSVEGESVERVWVEYMPSGDKGKAKGTEWRQVGRSLWKAPYAFSLDQGKLPQGKVLLRLATVNVWGEKAVSDPVEIAVSPVRN
jgi:hypothetical protein